MQQEALNLGFLLQPTTTAFYITPIIGGKPLSNEEIQNLDENIKKEIEKKEETLEQKIEENIKKLRKMDKELIDKLKEMDKEVAQKWIDFYIQELIQELNNIILDNEKEKLDNYFQDLKKDIMDNLENFLKFKNNEDSIPTKYKVNLFIDNSKLDNIPIVFEESPNLENLLGKVDKEVYQGILITDFTMITPGSLHKANGGYIIINIIDLLKEPFAYEALKKTIKNKKIIIEDIYQHLGISTKILKPQPIPFNAKVILLGPSLIYHILNELDQDFNEYFQIVAYFDSNLELNKIINNYTLEKINDKKIDKIDYEKIRKNIIKSYINSILNLGLKNNLKKLNEDAVIELLKYIHRISDNKEKLTLKMSKIENILIEVNHLTKNDEINNEAIIKAIEHWEYRNGIYKEKIQEYILKDIININTQGKEVGTVNGLAYIKIGELSFGKPTKITCSIGLGKEGIISIEKEAGFSGQIHNKAVMIITGYFIQKYAQDFPLTLQARISFEQNYSILEGDSASLAEVLALISQISNIPVKQNLAITGSMNQLGQAQPVGGIKEKIEGFFEICKYRNHFPAYVIIPHQNINDLILKEEVIQYIKEKKFKIYAVKNIDEVIKIATDTDARIVHKKVISKLKEFYLKSTQKNNKKNKTPKKKAKK
jgi:lon-related putative ATP-dependent protease